MATIKVRKDGPYRVQGAVALVDHEGNAIPVGADFVLCRCGHSRTKPFCDGSHQRVGFADAALDSGE
jgi:3-phenylpropionate/trans-cinnamate dioxygenase ferredoxin subunit